MSDGQDKEKPVLPAAAVEAQAAGLGILFWFGVGGTFLIVCFAIWFKWFHVASSTEAADVGAQRIVVINTSKIIAAATKKVIDHPESSTSNDVAKLGTKLSDAINGYRDGGALVLNSYAVIYCPPELDKTAEVAAKVGVKLE